MFRDIFPCFNRNAKKIEINGIDILANIVSPELHAWKQDIMVGPHGCQERGRAYRL